MFARFNREGFFIHYLGNFRQAFFAKFLPLFFSGLNAINFFGNLRDGARVFNPFNFHIHKFCDLCFEICNLPFYIIQYFFICAELIAFVFSVFIQFFQCRFAMGFT